MEITINLPEEYSFKRAGYDMTIRLADFSADILAQAVTEGLKSTIGDAASASASGAWEQQKGEDDPDWKNLSKERKKAFVLANADAVAEYGHTLMLKRIDALRAGDWTIRAAAGDGLSRFQLYCANVVKEQMTFDKGVSTADRVKAAFAAYEAQPDAVREQIGAIAKQRMAADDAPKGLGLQLKL